MCLCRADFDATGVHNPQVVKLHREPVYLLFYIGLNCLALPGKDCERFQSIGSLLDSNDAGGWPDMGLRALAMSGFQQATSLSPPSP